MPTNEYEHLQSVIRKIHNKIVTEDFKSDIPDDDLSTPESSLKRACLIKDKDSADLVQLRLWLFYVMREYCKRFSPSFYAFPVDEYQASVVFKPQVVFWLWEPQSEARRRNRPAKRVRASFRLVKESSESITQSTIDQMKARIRSAFPKGYRFKTGRLKASYRDKDNGIELIVAPYSKAEAKELISKILDVASVSPDWSRLTLSEYVEKNYSAQRTVQILGKTKKLPDQRPIATVYLKRVDLHIHGSTDSVTVYNSYVQ